MFEDLKKYRESFIAAGGVDKHVPDGLFVHFKHGTSPKSLATASKKGKVSRPEAHHATSK